MQAEGELTARPAVPSLAASFFSSLSPRSRAPQYSAASSGRLALLYTGRLFRLDARVGGGAGGAHKLDLVGTRHTSARPTASPPARHGVGSCFARNRGAERGRRALGRDIVTAPASGQRRPLPRERGTCSHGRLRST